MELDLSATILGVVLLACAIALLAGSLLRSAPKPVADSLFPTQNAGAVFLFDGDSLVDCNAAGRHILSQSGIKTGDWHRLIAFLTPYFQDLEGMIKKLPQLGVVAQTGAADNGKVILLEAEINAGLTRICLTDPDIAEGPGLSLALAHRAMQREVQDLRKALAAAPALIWRESEQGDIIWANDAYLMLGSSLLPKGQALSWPLPRIFDRSAAVQSAEGQRQSVVTLGPKNVTKTLWFDLQTHRDGAALLCFASPADAAVAAENSLREFMQTLSKTFAQLPIGLAIFDKDRKLQMFNPALLELTTLPPDFLTLKPTLMAVLDAMRERNLLPEPKDYSAWRRQITEIERAAAAGLFQETWALADGQTFRVTGRPHPNGGLALMIEDISTEMQRSRRYRADLEVSQSVLDHIPDAIAVFSAAGQVIWCNQSYTDLWEHDPATGLGNVTIRTMTDHWKTRAAPSALWTELDEYIHTIGMRQAWTKDLRLLDGRLVTCHIAPVAAGATMIAFHVQPAAIPAAKPARQQVTAAVK